MLSVDIQMHQPYARVQASPPFTLHAQFTLAAGHCLGVMGASGAGKTTLLHALAGLLMPAQGVMRCGEQVWFDAAQGICMPPSQRRVGLVFQEGRLFPHLSVLQNLRYGFPAGQAVSIGFEEVVETLAISHLLERKPAALSGGERQRVAIGRALLSQPAVLLMDEPLSGLDEVLKQQVLPYIQQVIQHFGLPTLYVSHAPDEVNSVADEVMLLAQGALRQPAASDD